LPLDQYLRFSLSAISKSSAIATARSYASLDNSQPIQVEAVLALFTDRHGLSLGATEAAPLPGNRLAWVVTYTGVVYLIGSGPPDAALQANTEMNVVIDARSGAYVEGFSYR